METPVSENRYRLTCYVRDPRLSAIRNAWEYSPWRVSRVYDKMTAQTVPFATSKLNQKSAKDAVKLLEYTTTVTIKETATARYVLEKV